MISNHPQFIDAFREKKMVRIEFYSKADQGMVDRECAPLDYGPEVGNSDGLNRYWIWDYASPKEVNPIGLLPQQIVKLQVLGQGFDVQASGFAARAWVVPRDWSPNSESRDSASGAEVAKPVGLTAAKLS